MSKSIKISFNANPQAKVIPGSPLAEPELDEGGKRDWKVDNATFRAKIKYMQQTLRNLRRLDKFLYSKGGKVVLPDGVTVGQAQMLTMYSDYSKELENRGKEFTESLKQAGKKDRKKSTGGGTQLKKLYYISDDLADFLSNANYGNGLALSLVGILSDPDEIRRNGAISQADGGADANFTEDQFNIMRENLRANLDAYAKNKSKNKTDVVVSNADDFSPDSINVNAQLGLITRFRMANGNLILAAVSLIYAANDLYSHTSGSLIHPEGDLYELFTRPRTEWVLDGKNLNQKYGITKEEVYEVYAQNNNDERKALDYVKRRVPSIKEKDLEKFLYAIMDTDKSTLQRIKEYSKPSSKLPAGFVYTNAKTGVVAKTYVEQTENQTDDAWGTLLMMTMVWTNFYRIKNELISDPDKLAALDEADNVAEASRVQRVLSELIFAHTLANKPRKTAANTAKNAAKRAYAKANSPPKR
jgi:hypothetical protein